MNKNIQILDCTLRDGGLGLEDAEKNKIASIRFTEKDACSVAENLTLSEIDIIELGSIEITPDDRRGFCIYQDIQSISKVMPKKKNGNQLFAALYRGPDTPIEDIPEWNPSLCEAVRVIIRYSELQKSLDFCAALSTKGYKVFVQPMLTMRYSDEEIKDLIQKSNKMGAYALYFVDSYGYMQASDVMRLFKVYDQGLDKNIRIGFHSHNNINLALSNVLSFIEINTERKIIVDSCLLGMGQGAGNLQTELFIGYLKQNQEIRYSYSRVLEACEIIENYTEQGSWGYSVTRLLPAIYKTAYKYGIALRYHYRLRYSEMDVVLSEMPEDLRQRYTPENTVNLLERTGFFEEIKVEG
ncbi:hypothetical protein [Acetobacterium tundrae]|uniref:hypothetical protein n=1 Tax=Acetobacterium tundrae TaxID=132932 RepID=UPI00164ACA05|nr:hypothetical protein [Acetobacterium tundrae]